MLATLAVVAAALAASLSAAAAIDAATPSQHGTCPAQSR